jgi:hypothetical protein
MQIKRHEDEYILTASKKDMGRVLACLLEAAEALSRPEFFIRLGWAQEDVRSAVRQAGSVLSGKTPQLELNLPDGIEAIENPKRPRGSDQDGESG